MMAFNNALSARLDELRSSRNSGRMHNDNNGGNNAANPFRLSGGFQGPFTSNSTESNPIASRRLTGDFPKPPAMAPIGQMPTNATNGTSAVATDTQEPNPAITYKRAKLLEDKRNEYLVLQEHRKNFQAQMEVYQAQQAALEAQQQQEIEKITQELQQAGFHQGYQSEPTTPPEYRDTAFPAFSRPNRYSSSSITSPPGLSGRSHRSGSQLTSPPSDLSHNYQPPGSSDAVLPSKSVPGSRRGSNDRASAYIPETAGSARRNAAGPNRYSMPTTGFRSRNHDTVPEHSPSMTIGQLNTTSFLFDEEENPKESATSPDVKSYLQMTDDSFPILVRRDEQSNPPSTSSAALDLAFSPPQTSAGSNAVARQRYSEQTLPSSAMHALSNIGTASNQLAQHKSPENAGGSRQLNRHSMEASLAAYTKSNVSGSVATDDTARPNLTNFHPSYSTNDVPTLKNNRISATDLTPPKSQAQQFHNHNASLGRIPPNAVNRQSRELSSANEGRRDEARDYQQLSSVLQASAPAFSTPTTAPSPSDASSPFSNALSNVFPNAPYLGNYGMGGMQMLQMNSLPANNLPLYQQQQLQLYQQPQAGFLPFNTANAQFGSVNRFQDNQSRAVSRRAQNIEDHARFNNVQLESLQGEILGLCKDQHGCRYLQKKLEERNSHNVQMIFLETNQHVVDLMTDPFGNYLCQKLLEFSNDEQRTKLIHNAAPEMLKIALNSHGTRALQKMIEFVNTSEQTQTIINALKDRVVDLIQDLNGNHVIQKCLNRLTPQDAQFIFDAVAKHCVTVGTHRHGCCVLQRCIDHATGYQRAHLIAAIIDNSLQLVQDPFGNYVLQYIVDLQEACFTDPLCFTFEGKVPQLSKQKFSSNVVEKCIRGAQPSTTRMMIEEMMKPNELEKLLRDAYANYVVQTAMDYGDPEIKGRLVEAIRPLLPAIRQFPHGRRIQGKIASMEGHGRYSGSATPIDRSGRQTPIGHQMTSGPISNANTATTNGFNNFGNQGRSVYPPYTLSQAAQDFANQPSMFTAFNNNTQQNSVQPAQPFPRVAQTHGNFF